MPEETELLPCPFCGCERIIINDNGKFCAEDYKKILQVELSDEDITDTEKLKYYAMCASCGARSDVCEDINTVFEVWNARA